MNLWIEKAGPESTVQGSRRKGLRHFGMPWSGAADPVSLALANHLVGNQPTVAALEICFGGLQICFESSALIALGGAIATLKIDRQEYPFHQTLKVEAGSRLSLAIPALGVRSYLAIAGGIQVPQVLGSPSTYLPSRIGGHFGRRMQAGDRLTAGTPDARVLHRTTPNELRPFFSRQWVLRCCESAETEQLTSASRSMLFGHPRVVGQRSNRMGMQLVGDPLVMKSEAPLMNSSPVFPGILQCPPDGQPFLLSIDAQTTGGYPRVASVIRSERHRLGQMRPGDVVKWVEVSPREAAGHFQAKRRAIRAWIPSFELD